MRRLGAAHRRREADPANATKLSGVRVVWLWNHLVVLMLLLAPMSVASGQLRVVTYNVADLQGNQASLRFILGALADDPAPTTGSVRAPDVLVFQEVTINSANTLRSYLNDLDIPGTQYELATFTTNGGGGENALIYNALTMDEDGSGHRDLTNHTGPRATDRWKVNLLTLPGEPIYIYGSHFKADTGSTNESKRRSQANAMRVDADALGAGVNVIYAGDFNIYHVNEPAYQRLLDAGNGVAVDPRFNHNFNSAITHSQSPHDGSGGLVTGGMDDRFDFLLGSSSLMDGSGIDYDADAYRSFGNDGSHYNQAINNGTNSYFLPDEQALKADALAKASDHLQVVADFFLPASEPVRL